MPVGGFRTSGGSIVAAFISMLSEEDLLGTIKDDISVRHGVRWFPPVWKMIAHFLQHGVLMSEVDFGNTTKKYFGDITFEEAYAISKRHVSIQVSVGSGHGFVLNHVTSPRALVRTAVCASCALPGLMRPSPILCKASDGSLESFHPPGVSSFDGTITQDIPAARLTELFNCNNFIVSQVNPHLNFVLHLAEESHGRRRSTYAERGKNRRAAVTKLLRVANFLLLNIKYSIQKLLEVDLLNLRILRTLQGILVQDFQGHITVLPSLTFKDYCSIGAQPSRTRHAPIHPTRHSNHLGAHRNNQAHHGSRNGFEKSHRAVNRASENVEKSRQENPGALARERDPACESSRSEYKQQ